MSDDVGESIGKKPTNWLLVSALAALIGGGSGAGGFFAARTDFNPGDYVTKSEHATVSKSLAKRMEEIRADLREDVSEIKTDMRQIRQDVQQILVAVRANH